MSEITEKFEAAVATLVTDGPVKQRLVRAYVDHLDGLTEIKLPQEAGNVFRGLSSALHKVAPVGRETDIQASVQKMSAREAETHARTILDIYRLLLVTTRRADHLKVIESAPAASADSPPQFLVGSS